MVSVVSSTSLPPTRNYDDKKGDNNESRMMPSFMSLKKKQGEDNSNNYSSEKRISEATCNTTTMGSSSSLLSDFHMLSLTDSDTNSDENIDEQEVEEQQHHKDDSTPSSDQEQQGPSTKRNVNFDSIMIREYNRALGDNPATTHGPPLTLDWQFQDIGTIKVDEYESKRPPRRINHEMMIPGSIRKDILLNETTTTKQQIKCMESHVKSCRNKRQMTIAMQDFEEWNEVFEYIGRRFRRLRTGVSKQREQELLWEEAHQINNEKKKQKQQEEQSKEQQPCEQSQEQKREDSTLEDSEE